MGYDGSINIDTKINTSGMNKGTKAISASLKGVLSSVMAVAKTMAAVFIGGSIINGIKSLIGQFDIMGSSIGASVKTLSTSFDALKGAFVNLLLTALAPLIPYVITFVQWLTQMLNTLTAIITALFGVQKLTSGAASNTEDMKKNAKGALASFDQINVLSGGDKQNGPSVLPNVTIPPDLLAKVEEFKTKMLDFLAPVIEAWDRLKQALLPLGKTIWEGLKWAWDNILVPLGAWVISDLLPVFLDLLAGAADVLNEALIALAPIWQGFWDNFLKPLAEWAGSAIIDFLGWLTEKLYLLAAWIKENPSKFQDFIVIMLIFVGVFQLAGAIIGALAITVTGTVLAIVALFAALGVAIYLLIAHWDELSTTVKQLGFILSYYFSMIGESIKSAFTGALEFVGDKFRAVFEGVKSFVKGVINSIIDYINGMIDAVTGGINAIVDGVNILGGIIPGYEPVAAISAPKIPRLATGAVIPPNAEFAAILGDQRGGRNLEAPEGLIRQIIREEMGGSNSTLTVQMPVYLDSEKVYDGVKKVEFRRGPSLVGGLS